MSCGTEPGNLDPASLEDADISDEYEGETAVGSEVRFDGSWLSMSGDRVSCVL